MATLKMEDYCVLFVFVTCIGIPLRIWLYYYTYAGQDICKGSHRLVRIGVGARWAVIAHRLTLSELVKEE